MEAEFIACYDATSWAPWLRNFITRLRVVDSISKPLRVYCDNSAAVFFSKNNKSGSANKHIDIKYLVVRERVWEHQVTVENINTELMIIDPLTKRLPPNLYREHVEHMGLVDLWNA